MTTPILDSVFNFDNTAQRWRNSADGRFVSNETVRNEMFRHSDATHSTLENLTRRSYAGDINLAQWQVGVASELKDAHLAQAMYAVGGRDNMGFAEFGRVGQTLREQYAFLDKFAADIAAGNVSEAQALARANMYGNAATQSYWAEYAKASKGLINWRLGAAEHCGDCVSIANGSPYTEASLPAYPCDG